VILHNAAIFDTDRWPQQFAELYKRGWNSYELVGLSGGNLLRVFEGVERVAHELRHEPPAMDLYEKRKDLPIYRDNEDL
jgi:membrane dipeptidase